MSDRLNDGDLAALLRDALDGPELDTDRAWRRLRARRNRRRALRMTLAVSTIGTAAAVVIFFAGQPDSPAALNTPAGSLQATAAELQAGMQPQLGRLDSLLRMALIHDLDVVDHAVNELNEFEVRSTAEAATRDEQRDRLLRRRIQLLQHAIEDAQRANP